MPTLTPAPFDYFRVNSLDEAIKILNDKEEAKILAGGQSLIPLLKLRVIRPKALVDICKIKGLNYINEEDGFIRIGAITTHDNIVTSKLINSKCPLLSEAAIEIGDQQVRNMGTIGGSICHADPAADYSPALITLGAKIVIKEVESERVVNAEDFFIDAFTTSLKSNEVVKEIRVPILKPNTVCSFIKFVKYKQEFGIVNVATLLTLEDGVIKDVKITLGGVSMVPVRAKGVEDMLNEKKVTKELIEEASNYADKGLSPISDAHASSEYRRHLCKVLTKRSLFKALEKIDGVIK